MPPAALKALAVESGVTTVTLHQHATKDQRPNSRECCTFDEGKISRSYRLSPPAPGDQHRQRQQGQRYQHIEKAAEQEHQRGRASRSSFGLRLVVRSTKADV